MLGFIGDAVGAVADFAGDLAGGVTNAVGGVLGGAVDLGGDILGGAFGIVEDVVGGVAGGAFDLITSGLGSIVNTVSDAGGSVEDILKDLASGAGLEGLEGLDAFSVLFLLLGRLEEQQDANIQGLASLMDKKSALDTESLKKSAGEPNNFDELAARPEFQNLDTNISLLTQKIQRVEQDMQQTKVLSSQLVAREGQSNSQVIGNI